MNISKGNVLKVFVNGKELDTKYYTIENVSNKVNIILSEEYLKTLDNGEYTIKITSTLGNVETTFTVDNSKDDNTNQKPTTDKKMMQTINKICYERLLPKIQLKKKYKNR